MNPIIKMELAGKRIAEQLQPIRTRQEVGKQLHMTGERVRQIEMLALGKLEQRLKEQFEFKEPI